MHPNFDEAVRLCRDNDVSIGFSNPHFEVWLILHLEDYGSQDNAQEMKKCFNELSQDKKIWKNHNRYRKLAKHVFTFFKSDRHGVVRVGGHQWMVLSEEPGK